MNEENAASRDISTDTDPSWEDPVFAGALARIQAAPCFRGLDLRQQKLWAEAQVEADRFQRELDLENSRTAFAADESRS
jgi:hypothetical protein